MTTIGRKDQETNLYVRQGLSVLDRKEIRSFLLCLAQLVTLNIIKKKDDRRIDANPGKVV